MKRKVSKIMLVSVVTLIMCIAFTISASGAVVKREKIVAVDGSGDFTTITAALNAITDASESKRYRITVRPGIYNEAVTMKQYVDIVGSGQENTKITSGSVGSVNYCPSLGTVVMASDSRLENIYVENTNTTGCRIAINITEKTNVVVDKVKAKTSGNFSSAVIHAAIYVRSFSYSGVINIKNSTTVASGTAPGPTNDANGILLYSNDTATEVYIDNATASCETASSSYCGGIAIWNRHKLLNISNSTSRAIGGNEAYGITIWGGPPSIVKIYNVVAEAEQGTNRNIGIANWESIGYIDRSRMTAKGASSYGVFSEGASTEINNSQITGETFGASGIGNPLKIGSSLIGGGYNCSGCKIVNCHDGDYNPIPNL